MRFFNGRRVATGGTVEGTVTGLVPNRMRKNGNQLLLAAMPSLAAHSTSTTTFVITFPQISRTRRVKKPSSHLDEGLSFPLAVRSCSRAFQVSSKLLLRHARPLLYRRSPCCDHNHVVALPIFDHQDLPIFHWSALVFALLFRIWVLKGTVGLPAAWCCGELVLERRSCNGAVSQYSADLPSSFLRVLSVQNHRNSLILFLAGHPIKLTPSFSGVK